MHSLRENMGNNIMKSFSFSMKWVALGGLVLFTTACSSFLGKPTPDTSRTYVLGTYMPQKGLDVSFEPRFVVGIQSVMIPAYLDRPQVVTSTKSNQVQAQEFLRWGEPLQNGVQRVFQQQISEVLHDDFVVSAPWSSDLNPNYLVSIRIHELLIAPQDLVVLNATCEYLDATTKQHLGLKHFVKSISVRGFSESRMMEAVESLFKEFAYAVATDIEATLAGASELKNSNSNISVVSNEMPLVESQGNGAVADDADQKLYVFAKEAVYVTVDEKDSGTRLFSGRLEKGKSVECPIDRAIRITPSNKSVVRVYYSSGKAYAMTPSELPYIDLP